MILLLVENIYKRESGDQYDGYGNGFIEYNGTSAAESKAIGSIYPYRLRKLEV
jgi:hypothetical protein